MIGAEAHFPEWAGCPVLVREARARAEAARLAQAGYEDDDGNQDHDHALFFLRARDVVREHVEEHHFDVVLPLRYVWIVERQRQGQVEPETGVPQAHVGNQGNQQNQPEARRYLETAAVRADADEHGNGQQIDGVRAKRKLLDLVPDVRQRHEQDEHVERPFGALHRPEYHDDPEPDVKQIRNGRVDRRLDREQHLL